MARIKQLEQHETQINKKQQPFRINCVFGYFKTHYLCPLITEMLQVCTIYNFCKTNDMGISYAIEIKPTIC